MALLALAHAAFSILQYHAFGNGNPLVSVLSSNPDVRSLAGFPFEWFGLVTLIVVLTMAATSHDFWLSALGPAVWKALHMSVYVAYAALLAHVSLGLLQVERHPFFSIVFGSLAVATVAVHVVAARREAPRDRPVPAREGWVDLCAAAEIPDGRAKIGMVGRERVAVFRYDGKLSAVSNVCRHQNGPLGEGRIVDGCITCPWHGYQYRPDSGTSPPPFNDKIPTYDLSLIDGRVLVRERANPPGTRVEPLPIASSAAAEEGHEFYVGYLPKAPAGTGRFVGNAVVTILVLAAALQSGFALAQRSYDPSRFEFGTLTTIEGTVRTHPYPMLEVDHPASANGSVSRYLLAAAGKHGAQAVTEGQDGQRRRLRGTLAYRDNLTLLEIAGSEPGSAGPPPQVEPALKDHGKFDLAGEIVDSKCYLGVMNPGRGKTHRGCAARCLAGGLTPLFVVKDEHGAPLEMVLLTDRGEPFPDVGRLAGKPIRLAGRILSQGDLWVLQAAPSTVRDRP